MDHRLVKTFLHQPTNYKVFSLYKRIYFFFGVPKRIRTDPGSPSSSKSSSQFCRERFFDHIEYAIDGHQEKRKIERCSHFLTERLRGNKGIVHKRYNTGLPETFFSLRTARGHKTQLPAEMKMGCQRHIIFGLLKP